MDIAHNNKTIWLILCRFPVVVPRLWSKHGQWRFGGFLFHWADRSTWACLGTHHKLVNYWNLRNLESQLEKSGNSTCSHPLEAAVSYSWLSLLQTINIWLINTDELQKVIKTLITISDSFKIVFWEIQSLFLHFRRTLPKCYQSLQTSFQYKTLFLCLQILHIYHDQDNIVTIMTMI